MIPLTEYIRRCVAAARAASTHSVPIHCDQLMQLCDVVDGLTLVPGAIQKTNALLRECAMRIYSRWRGATEYTVGIGVDAACEEAEELVKAMSVSEWLEWETEDELPAPKCDEP